MLIIECVKTICVLNVANRCLHSNCICTWLLNRSRIRTESKDAIILCVARVYMILFVINLLIVPLH